MSDQDASEPTTTEPVFTTDDVQRLNRMAIERAAVIARIAGTASIVVGAVVGLAWAWLAVRTQQRVSGSLLVDSRGSADLVDRVDLFVGSAALLAFAALTCVLGVALRLIADFIQDRAGGSITGYKVGDELPEQKDFELVAELEP